MPPAKFQMSEKLRAEIKAKGDFSIFQSILWINAMR